MNNLDTRSITLMISSFTVSISTVIVLAVCVHRKYRIRKLQSVGGTDLAKESTTPEIITDEFSASSHQLKAISQQPTESQIVLIAREDNRIDLSEKLQSRRESNKRRLGSKWEDAERTDFSNENATMVEDESGTKLDSLFAQDRNDSLNKNATTEEDESRTKLDSLFAPGTNSEDKTMKRKLSTSSGTNSEDKTMKRKPSTSSAEESSISAYKPKLGLVETSNTQRCKQWDLWSDDEESNDSLNESATTEGDEPRTNLDSSPDESSISSFKPKLRPFEPSINQACQIRDIDYMWSKDIPLAAIMGVNITDDKPVVWAPPPPPDPPNPY